MDALRVGALLAFIAIAGLVVYVIIRSRTAGRESRESRAFAEGVAAVAARVDASMASSLDVIDELRRHRMAAGDALPAVDAALNAVGGFVSEVDALPAVKPATDLCVQLVEDLRRAERALDRVQYGTRKLVGSSARVNDLEGHASVKRGYLELQHARDAFSRHAAEASLPPRGAGKRG